MSFSVKKDLTSKPNTVDLKILNLNPDHRSAIEQLKAARVQIEAGYESGTSVIFIGDLRTSVSTWSDSDCTTSLSAGDGEKAIQRSRINLSVKKNTKTADVLKMVARALGVGEGNLNAAASKLSSSGIADVFAAGTVLTGSAAREMTSICRSSKLTWSIQDGKLQILPLRQTLAGEALYISPSTGLVGSPSVDNKKILSCKIKIIQDVFPGRKMVIESNRIKGQYRIEECTYAGETHGDAWDIDIKAKRY